MHYTGALTATVHVVCIFLSLFLFCYLCILFKFSFSDNLYILFCVIKNGKKKIMPVLGIAKYSLLLYYGYRCLMGFFILLFNANFSECVLVCLNVFCY